MFTVPTQKYEPKPRKIRDVNYGYFSFNWDDQPVGTREESEQGLVDYKTGLKVELNTPRTPCIIP